MNQEIPNSGGDTIATMVNASWFRGTCPPSWGDFPLV